MSDAPTPPAPTAVPELDADGKRAAARAMWELRPIAAPITWGEVPWANKDWYERRAEAAIRAYLSTVSPERGETVICRICETEQPVNQRGVIKRHDAKNSDFHCDGSLKPEVWGLPVEGTR